jgi:ABC-type polysaccharide/polyol phosphate transport system ATPase subunit
MRENIYLIGSIMGLSKKEVQGVFEEIVQFSDLKEFVDTKVYQFSSGMVTRLTFSIFIHCINLIHPEILLLDEVIGAGGDIDFTKKATEKMKELVLGGSTVLFVSHGLGEVENYCTKTLWIEKGRVKMFGDTKEVTQKYRESVQTIDTNKI